MDYDGAGDEKSVDECVSLGGVECGADGVEEGGNVGFD